MGWLAVVAALAGASLGVAGTTYYSRLAAAVAAAIGRRDASLVRTLTARAFPCFPRRSCSGRSAMPGCIQAAMRITLEVGDRARRPLGCELGSCTAISAHAPCGMQADAQTPKAQQPAGYQRLALEPADYGDEESAASSKEPLMESESALSAQDDEEPPSPFMRLQ